MIDDGFSGTMQLDQALFEVQQGVVGKSRLVERLMIGLLAGGNVLVSGPAGIGKSYVAASLGHVFSLAVTEMAADDSTTNVLTASDGELKVIVGLEAASQSALRALAHDLAAEPNAGLVATTTGEDPDRLPRELRDQMLMFVTVDYPDADEEREMIRQAHEGGPVIDRILQPEDLVRLRSLLHHVDVPDRVIDYALRLVHATRDPGDFGLRNLEGLIEGGVSPRASISLVQATRATALLRGRQRAEAQDVFDVAYDVLFHRLDLSPSARARRIGRGDILVELLSRVSGS